MIQGLIESVVAAEEQRGEGGREVVEGVVEV